MLDLDLLVLNTKNPKARRYVEESIKSYVVGNLRSSIIVIWTAGMLDLAEKFQKLVSDREPTAVARWATLKQRIEGHSNWETELLEAARAADMISRYEYDILDGLRKTRNKYAHPSFDDAGSLFDPTPEEVRHVIRTVFDIILSQEAQLGAFYVNSILESIKSPGYFLTNFNLSTLDNIRAEVFRKFQRVNSRQHERLISQLTEQLANSESVEHKLNVLGFVLTLWGHQEELGLTFVSEIINRYIQDRGADFDLVFALIYFPEKIPSFSEDVQGQIKRMVNRSFIPRHDFKSHMTRFFSYRDSSAFVREIEQELPASTLIDRVSNYRAYAYLHEILGEERFYDDLGRIVIGHLRGAIQSTGGYRVRDEFEAIKDLSFWRLSEHIPLNERDEFAEEIINSVFNNNFATMGLFSADKWQDIPTNWANILYNALIDGLERWPARRTSVAHYFDQFIGILASYQRHFGNFPANIQQVGGYREDIWGASLFQKVHELEPALKQTWDSLVTTLGWPQVPNNT